MGNIDSTTIVRIKEVAKQKGFTQTYLCKQIGKRATFFNEVNHGKDRIDRGEIELLAKLLSTTPSYLLGETDDPSPAEEKENADENELLMLYRSLSDSKKEALKNFIEAMNGKDEQK